MSLPLVRDNVARSGWAYWGAADHMMRNFHGTVMAGSVAGITALALGTLPAGAGAAVQRGASSPTGICASFGSLSALAAAISRRVLRWVQRRAPETPGVAV